MNIFPRFMEAPFTRLGVAIAFSPRIRALLAETARLKKLWNASLSIIHVGEKTKNEEKLLQEHLEAVGLAESSDVRIFWEEGKPSEKILSRCKKEGVELLIAGALKKEKLIQYYLGTVARKILRKADCSVLMLTDPRTAPLPFQNIVVNAENTANVSHVLHTAIALARFDNAQWVHIARELKLYGLTMSASENYSEEEYESVRHSLVKDEIASVQKMLESVHHEGTKINIKLLSGKSGFELSKFAQRKLADLLIVGAPPRRFSLFDRVFTHDLEYIFADLPCNLLVVHPRKEVKHG